MKTVEEGKLYGLENQHFGKTHAHLGEDLCQTGQVTIVHFIFIFVFLFLYFLSSFFTYLFDFSLVNKFCCFISQATKTSYIMSFLCFS